MNEWQQIENKLEGDFIPSAFPVIVEQGVNDAYVYMHSVGCSIWNTLGHEMGYMAVVEGPAPVASGDNIRSDSVWFDKQSNVPKVLVEFERYDGSTSGKTKLTEKLSNLMEASMRWNHQPDVLVLSAWSPSLVSAPDIQGLQNRFREGITNKKGIKLVPSAGCKLLVHRMVMQCGNDQLMRLKHMQYWWS